MATSAPLNQSPVRSVVVFAPKLIGELFHPILVAGGLQVLELVESPGSLIRLLTSASPDAVLVLNIGLPEHTLVRHARHFPATSILMVRPGRESCRLEERTSDDAYGIIHSSADLRTVFRALCGRMTCRRQPNRVSSESPFDAPCGKLTSREHECLLLMAEGASTNDDLAAAMGIKWATARTHRQNLLSKMGAHSAIEAIAIAHRIGLLP